MPLSVSQAHVLIHIRWQRNWQKKAALLVVEKPVELEDGCKTAVVQVASTRDIVAALAAAFYGYPSEKVVFIGITGSKGKTTCTHMMADILRAAGYLTGTIGQTVP